ncbi:DUF5703 domain-containing protein [Hufsiella ginkgonis]|uniref:DUF5703 domain-containing protein n=1 Tax=Hufsiella ginkgonis TaxID=2695274 RepID=A0A7K1XW89_9SPHI|nr:DUF5703 domain-containing protein [Hufsiella ginkgonis]MXV15245.1 hypothetical protein [Hufsiella ginkgonis]
MRRWIILLLVFSGKLAFSQQVDQYNLTWNSPSKNAGESMPCGGGDTGLNVWVEKGDLLFYIARSGSFDENNSLLKAGRIRIKLFPNPFENGTSFTQELVLRDGFISIRGVKNGLQAHVKIWADVFQPVAHVEIVANKPLSASVAYESWRYRDRVITGRENNGNSWKWAPQGEVKTAKDEVGFDGDQVRFFHGNAESTVFDAVVKQQGLDQVKSQLYNPLHGLVFGGMLTGKDMKAAGTYEGKYLDTDFRGWKLESTRPAKTHQAAVFLHTSLAGSASEWQTGLEAVMTAANKTKYVVLKKNLEWWHSFWDRSFVLIDPGKAAKPSAEWQAGRNYQLFRYLLGCNATGNWPTKFNGGLFTVDPSVTDSAMKFTPDFRNWGGGTHTAQNQRLVYWPMLKSGDADLMRPQFDFYLRLLRNAELRTETAWNHKGASFTEQLENFGLPNPAEYGWKRPPGYDKGMEYNAWLEYEWDTVLEFCLMMLETERYAGKDIAEYVPFIESCLTFFNEHYQYLAKNRGSKAFDAAGKLVLYPGSAAETYKMTYNSSSTVAALKTVLTRLLMLPPSAVPASHRKDLETMLGRIPPVNFQQFSGHPTIAPAKVWERVNNTESPQLYPVFPWGMYGIGKPGLDTAINTYRFDPDVLKFRSHVGWKQDNIFAARLGLTDDAAALTLAKLKDSGRRFPAFWGPGYDWAPDHNWGGSAMIGLQEMLMQTDGRRILLFPAWPSSWDVHFKLSAPYQTTVEAVFSNGKVVSVKVSPESRRNDVVLMK